MIYLKMYTKMCFVFSLHLVTARKYDVESEAMRLYGEDFRSVLAKFRRTPDYLQILQEKYHEMTLFFSEIATYAMQYTMDNRLKKRIADACGYEETAASKYYYKAHEGRRQDDIPDTTPHGPEGEHDPSLSSKSPIDLLEHYSHFKSALSVQERNGIRDLAFEVTGQMIHMIIQSMGPVEGPIKSTRLPFGGEAGEVSTTTEKDHRHKITKAHNEGEFVLSTSTTNEPDQASPETYRYRYKSRPVN